MRILEGTYLKKYRIAELVLLNPASLHEYTESFQEVQIIFLKIFENNCDMVSAEFSTSFISQLPRCTKKPTIGTMVN